MREESGKGRGEGKSLNSLGAQHTVEAKTNGALETWEETGRGSPEYQPEEAPRF